MRPVPDGAMRWGSSSKRAKQERYCSIAKNQNSTASPLEGLDIISSLSGAIMRNNRKRICRALTWLWVGNLICEESPAARLFLSASSVNRQPAGNILGEILAEVRLATHRHFSTIPRRRSSPLGNRYRDRVHRCHCSRQAACWRCERHIRSRVLRNGGTKRWVADDDQAAARGIRLRHSCVP